MAINQDPVKGAKLVSKIKGLDMNLLEQIKMGRKQTSQQIAFMEEDTLVHMGKATTLRPM